MLQKPQKYSDRDPSSDVHFKVQAVKSRENPRNVPKHRHRANIGASIIRIGLWGILYFN